MNGFWGLVLYVLIFIIEFVFGTWFIKGAIDKFIDGAYFFGAVDALLALCSAFILADMVFNG